MRRRRNDPLYVVDGSGCWLWQRNLDWNGYALHYLGRLPDGRSKMVRAHRWMYEENVGPIPEGLHLDHLCRVRHCVNPAHLEPVTPRENLMRGDTAAARKAAQTSCVNGHAFDEINTYLTPSGHRACRACKRERGRRYDAERKALA